MNICRFSGGSRWNVGQLLVKSEMVTKIIIGPGISAIAPIHNKTDAIC